MMHTRALGVEWLAGLWEGEGCFTIASRGRSFRAVLRMHDLDTMEEVTRQMNALTSAPIRREVLAHVTIVKNQHKTCYQTQISGRRAFEFARVLYPYLMSRRRARLRELFERFGAGSLHEK